MHYTLGGRAGKYEIPPHAQVIIVRKLRENLLISSEKYRNHYLPSTPQRHAGVLKSLFTWLAAIPLWLGCCCNG